MSRSNELLVLAGGFGTRLRSAVPEMPKPLAPVADRPYIYYLLENWVKQGVTKFTFLLHYQADLINAFLESLNKEGLLPGCKVRTLTETQPMGTGGAVAFAVHHLKLTGSFLVTNADTWLGSGIEMISTATIPAMGIVNVNNTERYGSVLFQHDRIIAFEEKKDCSGAGWINAGLYHLHADLFNDWGGQPFSLESDLFPKLVDSGKMKAIPLNTEFIDIGIPEDYFRFCNWIKSGKTGVL